MRTLLPIALVLLGCAAATDAPAQVRRCVTPENQVVYTDQRCDALGAIEQPARQLRPGRAQYRAGCARTVRDLAFEVGEAINANDPNRLASFYHWTGMSTRQAYAVVSRLQTVVRRPLVDIVPVMPGGAADDYYPQTTVRQRPVALRIEQTLVDSATPARAVFGLQRHLGCWWLRG